MPHILIIDDDQLAGEAAQILLRSRGYRVTLTQDGASGIEAVMAARFDLAIVDLFMPKLNGLEVMKAIRQSDPNIPMIAMSGFMFSGSCPEMPGFEAMATEAGAACTLYKPFRPSDMLQAIATLIVPAEHTGDTSVGYSF
jgi:CheY-like chemotaxis protein